MNTSDTPSSSKNGRVRNAGPIGLQSRSNPVAYNPAGLVKRAAAKKGKSASSSAAVSAAASSSSSSSVATAVTPTLVTPVEVLDSDEEMVAGSPGLDADPTRKEVIEQLSSHLIGGSVDEKRGMLKELFANRVLIAARIKLLVVGDERIGVRLAESFQSLVPSSTTRLNSKKLSELIYDITVIFEEFKERLPDGLSRTSNFMSRLLSLTSDAVSLARNIALDKRQAKLKNCTVKLTGQQLTRRFLVGGKRSEDAAHHGCPFCDSSHRCVDEPSSNAETHRANVQALVDYRDLKVAYDASVARGVPFVRGGKTYARAPKAPTPKPIYFVCHCRQQHCWGDKPSETSCVIGCLDEEADRYGRDSKGKCLCPLCKCKCRVAFKVSLNTSLFIISFIVTYQSLSAGSISGCSRRTTATRFGAGAG